jgi:stage V sporulation protein AE
MTGHRQHPERAATFVPDVIVVTDGDHTAWEAIRDACEALDCYALRASMGNPTPLDGDALVEAVVRTGRSPVVVMVDDQGASDRGPGEEALKTFLESPRVHVLGVVAVASHTPGVDGVTPDFSIDATGERVSGAVNKEGDQAGRVLRGDTVDVLAEADPALTVVGLGDPGKMGGRDRPERGEPATRAAIAALLKRRDARGPAAR